MDVRLDAIDGQKWIVKSASSTSDAARLRREADQLRRAAHPGVVEMGAFRTTAPLELRTRHAGRALTETAPLTPAELCGLGAAVATVLADLHDLGIVHGAVTADHILIGADGRPVLCGFGSSGSTEERDAGEDVIDLAGTLSAGLGPDAPRRLRRLLLSAGKGRRHTPSARAFATALSEAVAERRLPAPASADGPPTLPLGVKASPGGPADPLSRTPLRTRRLRAGRGPSRSARHLVRRPVLRRIQLGVVALVVVPVCAAAAISALAVVGHDRRRPAPVACPPADRGCGPVHVSTDAFTTPSGTFVIAVAHPVVVLGRWRCGAGSLPAALDPRTGRVWAWLSWAGPATTTVSAEAVGRRPGAITLRVLPGASGCDRLEVIGARGATTIMVPRDGRGA
jgi:hypothetical protein